MHEITLEEPITGAMWTDYYHDNELDYVKRKAKETGVAIIRMRRLSPYHVFDTNLEGTPE
jgi:hypothetical protein